MATAVDARALVGDLLEQLGITRPPRPVRAPQLRVTARFDAGVLLLPLGVAAFRLAPGALGEMPVLPGEVSLLARERLERLSRILGCAQGLSEIVLEYGPDGYRHCDVIWHLDHLAEPTIKIPGKGAE